MIDKWTPITGSAAILSLIVSMVSLYISHQQSGLSYRQLELSTKPSVDFITANDPEAPPIGLAISNSGPGPARIVWIHYYVDRKLVRDLTEAVDYGKLSKDHFEEMEFEEDDTLAVNDKTWLFKYHRRGKSDSSEANKFADFVDKNLSAKVRFCSIMADNDSSPTLCWEKCSAKERC